MEPAELYQHLLRKIQPLRACQETALSYSSFYPSERLVQAIWYDQRVRKDHLKTTCGKSIRVINPGFWNLEAGPDFKNAVVEIEGEGTRTGNVEVHLKVPDWHHHQHQDDPAYKDMLLHVVYSPDHMEKASSCAGKTLILGSYLEKPIEELADEIELEKYPYGSHAQVGLCENRIRLCSPDKLWNLIESAGFQRMLNKAARYRRWIEQQDTTDALTEAIAEALGYKHNRLQMRRIVKILKPAAKPQNVQEHLACLLGVGGFLPNSLPAAWSEDDKAYAKNLWDMWWKVRSTLEEPPLTKSEWKLSGVRPVNHPMRRMAALAHLTRQSPFVFLTQILTQSQNTQELKIHLSGWLTSAHDDYWSYHMHLGSHRLHKPLNLVGPDRANEMMVNVLLPFMLAHTQLYRKPELTNKILQLYRELPAGESNSVLRLAAHRLFGCTAPLTSRRHLKTACRQQGLHQIFTDFCLEDRSGCTTCMFPQMLAAIT